MSPQWWMPWQHVYTLHVLPLVSIGKAQVWCIDKTATSLYAIPEQATHWGLVFLSRAPVFHHLFFIALILNQEQQMKGIISYLGASRWWFAVPRKQTHSIEFCHFTMGDQVQRNVSVLRCLIFSTCKYLIPRACMGKGSCNSKKGEGWKVYLVPFVAGWKWTEVKQHNLLYPLVSQYIVNLGGDLS